MLKDSQQRAQATDPRRSFIVQAPAGSGKTEILTQRYLRLLSTVTAPEQIVALTFTRKAASEMRERILLALKKAATNSPAHSAHQQQTYQFATEALVRSKTLGWQLLEQPNRLRIITIDALCQMLCQAIPLTEKQIPYAQITDKPELHYRKAARACLRYALAEEALHQPLKQLLAHLDNRQDKLLSLFSDLLTKRDQWLPSLYKARAQDKASYEKMLAFIEQHELARFRDTIPLSLRDELCQLARQVASIEADPSKPRYLLRDWQSFEQLNREITSGLASLILTSQNSLRKSFDHHVGLKKGSCDNQLYEHLKAGSKTLFTLLNESPDFLEALLRVKDLPPPSYDAEQWQILQALFTLLPLLVGHLHLVFSEENELDFTAISQQALLSLGDEEQPTDLALYLDNSIHHLLVDEFQDTSIQQFQLLSQLVREWQPDDGRTLFVVGDPMQSIYRFRQAEVGLFLKAQQEGIGAVQLIPLELCCNFRSSPVIVDWINQRFRNIFPSRDDIESGAISFHASIHVRDNRENSYIQAWQFCDRRQEAQALVQLAVEELERYPDEEVAILVRSRGQLTEIMQLLREQNISFQGVEIEHLAKLPHLRDLWSLTQALLMPANRLVWLELLRSPFCGLSLADLHQIANFDKKQSIYYALSQLSALENLSEEGRVRAQFIYGVLANALAKRHQQSLVDWIAQTLKQLHGDKILTTSQQADLEQFWLMLEALNPVGQLPDLQQIKQEFDKLYSQRASPSRLQIMTIHKSKGLEFDSVILPGLSSKSNKKDSPILRWLKLPSQKHQELLLVSPVQAAHRESCLLYEYLAKLDSEKDNYESQRLLYVAATRAKKRLFLFDSSENASKGSFRFLLQEQLFLSKDEIKEEEKTTPPSLPCLSRLNLQYYFNPPTTTEAQASPLSFSINNNDARHFGIVAHELLQWICDHHPSNINALPWNLFRKRFKNLGFSEEEQQKAHDNLYQQIQRLFQDPIGLWLIKAHHQEKNEYELLIHEEGNMVTRIIDRTFIDQGIRWIIDFKTGSEEEETQRQHRQQVNQYAELLAIISSEPIRCGLYYLSTNHWLDWNYRKESENLAESPLAI